MRKKDERVVFLLVNRNLLDRVPLEVVHDADEAGLKSLPALPVLTYQVKNVLDDLIERKTMQIDVYYIRPEFLYVLLSGPHEIDQSYIFFTAEGWKYTDVPVTYLAEHKGAGILRLMGNTDSLDMDELVEAFLREGFDAKESLDFLTCAVKFFIDRKEATLVVGEDPEEDDDENA
jgi:hypothetical protein